MDSQDRQSGQDSKDWQDKKTRTELAGQVSFFFLFKLLERFLK
jgi:hypothetical protein